MYKKNAANKVYFVLLSSTTGAVVTGASVTAKVSIDSASQGSATGSVTELAGGQYRFDGAAADFNGDCIGLLFTATGAIPVAMTVRTQTKNMADLADVSASDVNAQCDSAIADAGVTTTVMARLDAAITTRAASSTALSNVTWSDTKAGYLDAAVTSRSSHSAADVWASGTRTLTSFGTLVADVATAVWGAGVRSLTTFGTLAADVWSSVTRSLTDKTNFQLAADQAVNVTKINSVSVELSTPPPTTTQITDAVLDEALSGHTTVGTVGHGIAKARVASYDSFTGVTVGGTDTLTLSDGSTQVVTSTGRVTTE